MNQTINIISELLIFPFDEALFYGYEIESPAKGDIIAQQEIKLAGWVVGKLPVQALEITKDEQIIAQIPLSVRRGRLVNYYGRQNLIDSYKDAETLGKTNFGFQQIISLKETSHSETSQLLLQAIFANKRRVPIGLIKLEKSNLEEKNMVKVPFPQMSEDKVNIVSECISFPVDENLFYGYQIESPTSNNLLAQQELNFSGWVVGKSPVVAIEIAENEQVIKEIPLSVRRGKLVKNYGRRNLITSYGDAEILQKTKFGFQQVVNLREMSLQSGWTELSMRAIFADNQRVPLGLLKLNSSSPESAVKAGLKPDFMIVGAMKAATSAIYDYLMRHPRVIHRKPKEVHFFTKPQRYQKGWSWYLSQFAAKQEVNPQQHSLIGEASPSYLSSHVAPTRIKEAFPDVKIIASLRNPTQRAISHYYHQVKRIQDENRSIEEAFSEDLMTQSFDAISRFGSQKERLRSHPAWKTIRYLVGGHYVDYLRNWYQIFPQEQILILNYHDLEKKPQQFLTDLFTFLDLQDHLITETEKVYANTYPLAPLSVRQRLDEYFKLFNEELAVLLNRDFGWNDNART